MPSFESDEATIAAAAAAVGMVWTMMDLVWLFLVLKDVVGIVDSVLRLQQASAILLLP